MIERRLRPISRLISWVRPPIRPLTDSRSLRVFVARGSIAYSLVTQPRPEPLRHLGGLSAGQVEPGRIVRPFPRCRLHQQQVGAAGQLDEGVARTGVSGVDQRAARSDDL